MTSLVKVAVSAIELFVRKGERLKADEKITNENENIKAGVFVSLKKHGTLRGCIGTFEPQCDNIIEEIIQNGISAATRDPRFAPVTSDELKDFVISVDVLTTPEPVKNVDNFNPKRFGAIVKSGWRKGLLLPDLDGVDTVEEQLSICRQKAGIAPDEKVDLFRFEVKRYN